MKKNKIIDNQSVMAVITFLVLVSLILIQVGWIFRAARLEEQHFNHRVAMAMKATLDEISHRAPMCSDMTDYLCGKKCSPKVHSKKNKEVDSIIQSNLNNYNISLPYHFEITDSIHYKSKTGLFKPASYLQNLSCIINQNGVQIKLQFPTRNQFLLGQIWSQLGLSVIFIIFVMYSFLMTLRLFRREKRLLVHTTDFINNMVHEFQTPIANVRFATNLLKKNQNLSESSKLTEYTNVILSETQRLQSHVEEILKVSCTAENSPESEVVNFENVIEYIIKTFSYRLEHSNANIEFINDAQNSNVLGDKVPFSLVISNLIDNALKYVTSQPNITIKTYNKDNKLYISVSDNGIGIAGDDKLRIFDKYFRVSTGDVHNVKGFGLGLTYVKRVTEQYGGSVNVESTIDKGSTFTLIFPLNNKNEA